jgi:tetratricopeptide (TPR) repeat protein
MLAAILHGCGDSGANKKKQVDDLLSQLSQSQDLTSLEGPLSDEEKNIIKLINDRQYGTALDLTKKGFDKNKNNTKLLLAMSSAYKYMKQYDAARQNLNHVIEVNPKSLSALYALSDIDYAEGQKLFLGSNFEKACSFFTNAEKKLLELEQKLGGFIIDETVYKVQVPIEYASIDRASIKINAEYTLRDIYCKFGQIYGSNEDQTYLKEEALKNAIKFFERTIYTSPTVDPKCYFTLGTAYFLTKDYSKAREILNQGLNRYPDDPNLKRILGYLTAEINVTAK